MIKDIKKYDINNLAEWCIILYLTNKPNSRRQDIARDLNINGARIGYVIAKLKRKGIVLTKIDENKKINVYYYLNPNYILGSN